MPGRLIALILSLSLILTFAAFADDGGKPAPDFRLKDLNNKMVSLDDLTKDGPVLIDFWAIWCQPCKQAMPHLNRFHEKYAKHGFKVACLSIDDNRTINRVRPFILGQKYTFHVLMDTDKQVFQKYRGNTPPITVLISQDKKIIKVWSGYHKGEEVEIEAEIAKHLGVEVEGK